ncbi:MAG: chitobiase/beta-hexosaminidase C-terminal domain-containing protein, partial [Planctomycetota bacterium]
MTWVVRTILLFALALLASTVVRAVDVEFSEPASLRADAFELKLSALGANEIRFTLDGSAPGANRGEVYSAPIRIESTTVVRAQASGEGAAKGRVVTRSYIFPQRVSAQTENPVGYPARFVSERHGTARPHVFDYAMDLSVVSGAKKVEKLSRALLALPTLSVALERDEFAEIYLAHRARGPLTERAASIELIYPPSKLYESFRGFQVDCGLRMQGGLAVDQARKKSFRLRFKKRYGPGKLRYPFFESAVHHASTAADSFEGLVLRAGGNANWSKDLAYKTNATTYLRDQLMRDTSIEVSGLGARGIYVHLYVNGFYFGIYNATERPDARFLASYLGGSE